MSQQDTREEWSAMVEQAPRWPDNARCAVMLTFDVDGPTNWINRDRRVWDYPKTFSLGSYGPWRGLPRTLDILEERQVPATFFVPGWVVESWPERMQDIITAGHEMGHHGYLHELYFDLAPSDQFRIIERCQAIFEDVVGARAVGFRTPSGDFRRDTPALLKELGFSYSSSMRGDDRPYRWQIDGELSELIEIPAHWELDDFPQFGYNIFPPMPAGQDRIASVKMTFDNWTREFDGYYRYGLCYVLMMHPQTIGKPGRAVALRRLIEYIQSHDDVWFATGGAIADWWRRSDSHATVNGGAS